MRVALITTTAPERCGIRTYAEELKRKIQEEDIEIDFIGRPFSAHSIHVRTAGYDIVHILHVNSLYPELTAPEFQRMKDRGQKIVCTFNDSTSNNRSVFTEVFDRVAVHQDTSDGFDLVYHGIPTTKLDPYDGSMDGYVGTSGFPIAFKQYPLAARLATAVGKKLFAILPDSQHADVQLVIRQIQEFCPGSVIDTSFPSHDEVLKKLSQCCFTLYPYSHAGTGIGGSARMGMATGRPVVISRVVRFADILAHQKYMDEFYIIPSGYPTFEESLPIVQQVMTDLHIAATESLSGLTPTKVKIPRLTIEDMSWEASARKYTQIYRELMA